MSLESSIQKSIAEWVRKEFKECRGNVLKVETASMAGYPDLICVLPNSVIVFIEVKQPGKTPSKLQERRIKEMRYMGHWVYVCTSLEEAKTAIRSHL